MHHFIFPTKATWISSGSSTIDGTSFKDQNFGQDQILELKKEYFNSTFNYQTRVLVQFDLSDISKSMDRAVSTTRTRDIKNPKFNSHSWFIVLDGNQIIGLNNLWKNQLDKVINTGLTGVRREYRRKGVATALKHTSLSWAKNQGYEWIRTDNASSNKGMLNINIGVGFKFMPAWLIFDKVLKEEK